MDAFALLDQIDDGTEDVVLSPYGVARALDVVRRGASGRTKAALDTVLGSDETPEVHADGLLLAQAAWLAAGYAPGPALTLETGPLEVTAVNAWANERTHGMIPAIVDRFGPDDILAITDAIFLDAKWRKPFARIGERPFAGAGDVAMMSVDGGFEHTETGVRLPYAEGELRLVAALGETLPDGGWSPGLGTVVMPVFGAESRHDLAEPLSALGLAPAFEPGMDLEALIAGPGEKALDRILQRARVDVDEQGTRAAAVTAVTAVAVAAFAPVERFELVFDRPFTWAIEHEPTGAVLFAGRVRRPREPKKNAL
jgi:serine protease inhibitor